MFMYSVRENEYTRHYYAYMFDRENTYSQSYVREEEEEYIYSMT